MDWFKLTDNYFDDVAIAMADDAGEVMFTRALAYCRRSRSGGFIPESVLLSLTRHPSAAKAKKTALQLTRDCPDGSPGPWYAVPGGYRVRRWSLHNDAADELEERRKNDRERQARRRATKKPGQSRDTSREVSRDTSRDVTDPEREGEEEAAAAANDAAAAADPTGPLDGRLDVLRSKLQAHTPLRGLRFDSLRPDQLEELLELVDLHGDDPLVGVAVATCRHPAPTHASAFLGTWAALPPPGQPLHVVRQQLCDTHGTKLSPAGVCSSCVADARVGDR